MAWCSDYPAASYAVPRQITFVRIPEPTRLIVIFSRSQTEQPGDPQDALRTFARHTTWREPGGLPVILRAEDTASDTAATYVVNRIGMPVVAAIPLLLK
jgi:hypothetical protein